MGSSEQNAGDGAREIVASDQEIMEMEASAEWASPEGSLMEGLSLKQMAAFGVLTNGGTIATAARAARVSRKTIYVWQEEGHPFATAFEQWKRSVAGTCRTRLLMIGEAATVLIARAIKGGDVRAALAVAKGMGLLSPPPVGETIVELEARKKKVEAKEVEQRAADSLSATPFKDLVNVDGFAEEMKEAEEREEGKIRMTNEGDGESDKVTG